MPDLVRELGASLHRDLGVYLSNPHSEEGDAVLASLPRRLQSPPAPGAAANQPPAFSTPLLTHVLLRVMQFSLAVRARLCCSAADARAAACAAVLACGARPPLLLPHVLLRMLQLSFAVRAHSTAFW